MVRPDSAKRAWERPARAVAWLEALDEGRPVRAGAGTDWKGVYGPDLVDVALDLLLDGVKGPVSVLPGERLSELEFAKALAVVADRDESLIVATGSPAPKPLFAWSEPVSYLPPWETTLERLVREARAARRLGDGGVQRRLDEVREEPAEVQPAMAAQGG